MGEIQRIDDERSAIALADLLNGHSRRRPVAVVTIPAGQTEPWIDVDDLARQAGRLADVYLMPTGAFTWEFSHRMSEGTQVYGGAGRVYPVGHEWTRDLTKSPLRFAFNAADGERATQDLISDMLRMAAAAGLLTTSSPSGGRRIRGRVVQTVAGRGLVDIGCPLPATIAEELTLDDVPITRLLRPGQRITGWRDPETNRIDVRASLRPASEALAEYAVGQVVLARVAMVRNGKAELVLYPKTNTPAVTVAVLRADVTTNPNDDLRTLMTVGEVVTARIAATGPKWALTLLDIDDDEPITPAPALLPEGPPWLIEDVDDPDLTISGSSSAPALPMPTSVSTTAADVAAPAVPAPHAPPSAPPVAAPRPTPALLDPYRPTPAAAGRAASTPIAVAPRVEALSQSTQELLLKIDALQAEVNRLTSAHEQLKSQFQAAADENAQLHYLRDGAERRANKAEHDLKHARVRLRKAGTSKAAASPCPEPRFADRELGFRHAVLTAWASRLPPDEQAIRPLPEYAVGPRFLGSLDDLEGIKPDKVADVAFEVLTGLAADIPGRELHRLRAGNGGGDPYLVREDGAQAFRVSLQVNTPSARRLHYWQLSNGQIELSRVVLHDDVQP
ncbi:hypothetical protein [Kribbia dieselivorans]|uniref:hypothetical protein n=1 Tax=Kribbia dieselivorans TaxID=331526 RepID=UPI000837DABA|nr:hypothetical protein [Kribbia dieselivorans]